MAKEIFGIELEVPLKRNVTINQFRECIISAIGSNLVHQPENNRLVGYHTPEYNINIDKWRVASDSSLHGFNGRGIEVVSRRRTTLEETKKVMESTRHLVDLELMNRTSCGGFHVHIGTMHFSAMKRSYKPEKAENCTRLREGACGQIHCPDCKQIQKLIRTKRVKLYEIKVHEIYAYFQPVIDALVSRSRRSFRNNTYCQAVSASYLRAKDNPNGIEAERKQTYLNDKLREAPFRGNRGNVNFGNIGTFGTVEYRQHQQTYNVATVQNWVKLMHRLNSRAWVQETKNINPSLFQITVDGFADFLGLGSNRLRSWMRRRANHFNYPVIAAPSGINPIIGSDIRNGNEITHSNVGCLQRFNERQSSRMLEELILQIENHRNLTDDLNDYRILCDDIGGEVDPIVVKEKCENWLLGQPCMDSEWFTRNRWDGLDWSAIARMIQNHEVL